MKSIKLCEKNHEKIIQKIDEVQHRCSARCCRLEDLLEEIRITEKKLSKFLYKKDQTGITVQLDPNAQTFPNAYKGIPESTHFTLKKTRDGWLILDISRYCTSSKVMKILSSDIINRKEEIAAFLAAKFY